MSDRMVHVPVSRLLDSAMTASAKVIGIALRLHPGASSEDIQAQTGLSRHTVKRRLGQVELGSRRTSRPGTSRPEKSSLMVRMPGGLLLDRKVSAQAKVLYGLLQATPNFHGYGGQFTYASLRELTQLGCNTLKRAIADLVGAGWITLAQKSRIGPVSFRLGTPEHRRSQLEAAVARRRLKRARFGGEAIMQEYLSLLIESDQFTDNARPGFLINPLSGERLELDRLYRSNVAFEFHGNQHDGATERYTQAEADAQHVRDLIKAGLCHYKEIHLVIVRAQDLSVQAMSKRIGQAMPLRSLKGQGPLIEVLEEASLMYRAAAKTGGRRSG